MFCSTSRIETPVPFNAARAPNTTPMSSGDSPKLGSSSSSTRGADTSARPIVSIWRVDAGIGVLVGHSDRLRRLRQLIQESEHVGNKGLVVWRHAEEPLEARSVRSGLLET